MRLFQTETNSDIYLVVSAPSRYRLDLDPSRFPPDWQSIGESYAVDVVAGSYTPVPVVLIPSYPLAGTIVDAHNKPRSKLVCVEKIYRYACH